MKEAEKILSLAKVDFTLNDKLKFFSAVFLRSEVKFSSDIPTACTDGFDIIINPDFFTNPRLSRENRLFVLFHETCHIVFDHIGRIYQKEPKKWNIACDHVINLMADDIGLSVIDGAFMDYSYRGMSAEQIYEQLDDIIDPSDFHLQTCLTQAPPNEEVGSQMHEDWIKSTILQANALTENLQSKDKAYIPEELREFIRETINPTIPWNRLLPNILSQLGFDDYCWLTRDTRYEEFYLPSVKSEESFPPHFYIDCSGSVSEEDYRKVIHHVMNSLSTINPEYIDITHFDTQIINTVRIPNRTSLQKMELYQGGGTDIDCVINSIKKLKPKVSIIFSDGYFDFYGENLVSPKTPIIWIIYGNAGFKPPYGKTILIEEL